MPVEDQEGSIKVSESHIIGHRDEMAVPQLSGAGMSFCLKENQPGIQMPVGREGEET